MSSALALPLLQRNFHKSPSVPREKVRACRASFPASRGRDFSFDYLEFAQFRYESRSLVPEIAFTEISFSLLLFFFEKLELSEGSKYPFFLSLSINHYQSIIYGWTKKDEQRVR